MNSLPVQKPRGRRAPSIAHLAVVTLAASLLATAPARATVYVVAESAGD